MIHAFRFSVKRACAILFLLLLFALFLSRPSLAPKAAEDGISLCLGTVIPCLFPFLVLGGMLSSLGFPALLGRVLGRPFRLLFGIGEAGACAYLFGLLSGFPGGAAMTVKLRDDGLLSDEEAARLVAIGAVPSPAFTIGGIGAGMLGDAKKGAAIWGILVLSTLLCGLFLRLLSPIGKKSAGSGKTPPPRPLPILFAESVSAAVRALAPVCGAIVFFSILASFLSSVFGAHGQLLLFLGGFLELTSGCARAAAFLPEALAPAVLSCFCAFAGCSVHAQIAMLVGDRFSLGPYFAVRLASVTVCLLLSLLFL